jgi:hypothetical protein
MCLRGDHARSGTHARGRTRGSERDELSRFLTGSKPTPPGTGQAIAR